MKEIAAYEALWDEWTDISYRKLARKFADEPGATPSSFVDGDTIERYKADVMDIIRCLSVSMSVLLNHTLDYPGKLRDAEYPIELLYGMGNLDYLGTRGVSVVGTRHPSEDGIQRAKRLARLLAPLNVVYPKANTDLQKFIAEKHLLLSQVPFIRYSRQNYMVNRFFFPERDKTMSALSEATVIVEAGETSGSLIQARAALKQGRKLFILNSCFENSAIGWPQTLEKKGAIRVRTFDDIIKHLG